MPSTTPSLPSTPTSSLTTSNPDREYLICQHSDGSAWYGYFEEDVCYWSGWHNSFTAALTSKLDKDPEEEPFEVFVEKANSDLIIRRLPGPITIDTHPEYFI